ncbi:hypothetical protein MKZ38_008221 [Zalerion maritima]|uniref:Uncharacterized protein n=1 Tax=Zalerion maritima TaxID=339359 RepID=A0AAD5WMK6_9PEZI|nr:hypothetical protein MKZ38_008221 [Zalerion maritima]
MPGPIKKEWLRQWVTPRAYVERCQSLRAHWELMNIDGSLSLLDFFLQDRISDSQDYDAPRTEELIRKFCEGSSMGQFVTGNTTKPEGAWVCARPPEPQTGDIADVHLLEPPKVLTAAKLDGTLKALSAQDDGRLDKAKPARIYINLLDGLMIRALAENSTFNQAPRLREALLRHMGFRPCIKVKQSVFSRTSFQLILDLPFFVLRPGGDFLPKLEPNSRPPRDIIDVSFFKLDPPGDDPSATEASSIACDTQEAAKWKIYATQFSLFVHGIDERRWTAYAFGDALYDDFLGDKDDHDLFMDLISHSTLATDQWTSNPREYFVSVLHPRVHLMLRSWKYLAEGVYISVERHISDEPADDGDEKANPLQWAKQTMSLLRRLLYVLSGVIMEWDRFYCPEKGDLDYFSDLFSEESTTSEKVRVMLLEVEDDFIELKSVRRDLMEAQSTCTDYCKNYDDTCRKVKNIQRKNMDRKSANLHRVMTNVFGPLQLTGSLFSTDEKALPLQLSQKNFWLVLGAFVLLAQVYGCLVEFVSSILCVALDGLQSLRPQPSMASRAATGGNGASDAGTRPREDDARNCDASQEQCSTSERQPATSPV